MLAEAKTISALCRAYHVPFILNDNVPLAKLCGADGVHVGQDDLSAAEARRLLGPDKIIGVSAHNVAEAEKGFADGADYLGCGAGFHPHQDGHQRDLPSGTGGCVRQRSSPVVAIGGIHRETCSSLPAAERPASPSSAPSLHSRISKPRAELRKMVRKL